MLKAKRVFEQPQAVMLVAAVVLALLGGVLGHPLPGFDDDLEEEDYSGYKIYRVFPKSDDDLDNLQKLVESQPELDVLFLSRDSETPSEILVKPDIQHDFESFLSEHDIESNVAVPDLQESLENEVDNSLFRRGLFEPGSYVGTLNLKQFYTYDDMLAHLKKLAATYPKTMRLFSAGKSYEGRDIPVVVISSDENLNKTTIVMDAGIHAREWIAPAEALYVISQLVEMQQDNKAVLEKLNWVILPVVNPDGYIHSHERARMWRKTRKPSTGICFGTDANRNFGFKWGGAGASKDGCSDTYRGEMAFSESESVAIRDTLDHFKHQTKFYLTLHSYGSYLLYPWGYSSELPQNWRQIHALAQAGADAIRKATGRKYKVGSSTRVLYAAAGGSDDYALGAMGIPYSITMELPRSGLTGFNPPTSSIEKLVSESWVGIKAMAMHLAAEYEQTGRVAGNSSRFSSTGSELKWEEY